MGFIADMNWLSIALPVLVYCGIVMAVMRHLAPGRKADRLDSNDAGIAVLEQRLHRELRKAS